jgi:RNA polymerase sigma-70 factor (ECF subfamily)
LDQPDRICDWGDIATHVKAAIVTEAQPDYSHFFYEEFAPVVRTVALIMRDPIRAEDVAQEAFLRLFLNWNKISRYENPAAWVRRVAIRLAVRAMRRDQLWSRIKRQLVPADPPRSSPYDLAGAISRLSATHRAAVVLHYYEDRPMAEVAELLGCSEPTARVRVHRARRRLAELLGGADVA